MTKEQALMLLRTMQRLDRPPLHVAIECAIGRRFFPPDWQGQDPCSVSGQKEIADILREWADAIWSPGGTIRAFGSALEELCDRFGVELYHDTPDSALPSSSFILYVDVLKQPNLGVEQARETRTWTGDEMASGLAAAESFARHADELAKRNFVFDIPDVPLPAAPDSERLILVDLLGLPEERRAEAYLAAWADGVPAESFLWPDRPAYDHEKHGKVGEVLPPEYPGKWGGSIAP